MTVTLYVAGVPDVQLRVEVWGEVTNVIFAGVSVHASPVGAEAEDVSEMVPVNPLTAFIEIVEVPGVPANCWAGIALAVMVKSTTVKVIAEVACDNVPSVPVTMTV